MESPSEPSPGPWAGTLWPLTTLGLLTTSWAAFLLTREYAHWLTEQWGLAPDVIDALRRDGYVGRRTLPYYTLMTLVDALAVWSLAMPARAGWPHVLKMLVGVLLVPTIFLHGLVWLVTLGFAN